MPIISAPIPASLPPSGTAGGVLDGTFPNPGLAAAVAGAGLAETADVLSVNVDATSLAITADTLGLVPAVVGGVVWTTVVKTVDESVASSTTVQNDDELFFATVNGAVYQIELAIVFASPAGGGTPDLKCDIGEDATARGAFDCQLLTTGDAAFTGTCSCNQSALTAGTAAANRLFNLTGEYGAGGGTFRFRWAQLNSDTNPVIVRAGSILRYRRIA